MPHNILMSKIRCSNPNKVGTRIRNRNHLVYIATREGVDLSPDRIDATDNSIHIKYLHERPKSHGLFGNLPTEKILNIDDLSSDIYQISKSTPIYRAIISLDERDAQELGYTNKEQWELYLNRVMPDLAKSFGIPQKALQWVGAVHMEQAHPHVHCMFWRSDGKIQTSYIHVSKQQKCRELLSEIMFSAERTQEVVNKTLKKDNVLSFGKKVLQEEIDLLNKITPGIYPQKNIIRKIRTEQLNALNKEYLTLFQMLPKRGRLDYEFVPAQTKKQVDLIVDMLKQHKDISLQVSEFVQHIDNISKTYSVSDKHSEVNRDKALKELNKDLGNVVLNSMRELLKECRTLKDCMENDVDLKKEDKESSYQNFLQTRSMAQSYQLFGRIFTNVWQSNHNQNISKCDREYRTVGRKVQREEARKRGKSQLEV